MVVAQLVMMSTVRRFNCQSSHWHTLLERLEVQKYPQSPLQRKPLMKSGKSCVSIPGLKLRLGRLNSHLGALKHRTCRALAPWLLEGAA